MTAVQLNAMNTQIWRDMGIIAEDESMMRRVAKYIRKVAKEMTEDPTTMSKEEFYAMIEEGEKAYERGETTRLLPGESVTDMLRRSGYDV